MEYPELHQRLDAAWLSLGPHMSAVSKQKVAAYGNQPTLNLEQNLADQYFIGVDLSLIADCMSVIIGEPGVPFDYHRFQAIIDEFPGPADKPTGHEVLGWILAFPQTIRAVR